MSLGEYEKTRLDLRPRVDRGVGTTLNLDLDHPPHALDGLCCQHDRGQGQHAEEQ